MTDSSPRNEQWGPPQPSPYGTPPVPPHGGNAPRGQQGYGGQPSYGTAPGQPYGSPTGAPFGNPAPAGGPQNGSAPRPPRAPKQKTTADGVPFGIGPFTLREIIILGLTVLLVVASFLPVISGGFIDYYSMWAPFTWLLIPGLLLVLAAAVLITLRRLVPSLRTKLRVGSLSVDQFASVAVIVTGSFYLGLLIIVGTASAAVGPFGAGFGVGSGVILGFVVSLALLVVTTLGSIIPPFSADFSGRVESPAHPAARPATAVAARPKQPRDAGANAPQGQWAPHNAAPAAPHGAPSHTGAYPAGGWNSTGQYGQGDRFGEQSQPGPFGQPGQQSQFGQQSQPGPFGQQGQPGPFGQQGQQGSFGQQTPFGQPGDGEQSHRDARPSTANDTDGEGASSTDSPLASGDGATAHEWARDDSSNGPQGSPLGAPSHTETSAFEALGLDDSDDVRSDQDVARDERDADPSNGGPQASAGAELDADANADARADATTADAETADGDPGSDDSSDPLASSSEVSEETVLRSDIPNFAPNVDFGGGNGARSTDPQDDDDDPDDAIPAHEATTAQSGDREAEPTPVSALRHVSEHETEVEPPAAVSTQPFWVYSPVPRPVFDEHTGVTVFEIGPSAWALAVVDRGTELVIRHDDGRVGVLRDLSNLTRG